jgi:hypothetical protein
MTTTRRTLLRTAAWTTPVIGIAATAPAFAASLRKDPGINGWVNVQYGTDNGFDARFDSDPDGQDPSTPDGAPFGLYVYDATTYTDARITLWFRGAVRDGFTENGTSTNVANNGGHGNGWGNPTNVGTQVKPDGLTYTGYRFLYTGTYTLGLDSRVYLQDFDVTARNVNSGDATFWVERSIKVDGVVQAFQRRNGERGPVGDGFPSARRAATAGVLL